MKLLKTYIDESGIDLGNRIVINLYEDYAAKEYVTIINWEINYIPTAMMELRGIKAIQAWNTGVNQ
jgi:hypothetical protein